MLILIRKQWLRGDHRRHTVAMQSSFNHLLSGRQEVRCLTPPMPQFLHYRTKARLKEIAELKYLAWCWLANKISTNVHRHHHLDYENGNDLHLNICKNSLMTLSINSLRYLLCFRKQTHKGKQGKKSHENAFVPHSLF